MVNYFRIEQVGIRALTCASDTVKSWNRYTPDSLAGDAPIAAVLEHVEHTLAAPGGNPINVIADFMLCK